MGKIVTYPWVLFPVLPHGLCPSCVLCPAGCTSAPCGSLPLSLSKCPEPLSPTAAPLYPGSAALLLHDVCLPTADGGMNVDASFTAVCRHPEQDWSPEQAPD
ncbi:hypothetical protein LOC151121 [Homo sapiens]|uniref:LOC151121 protein n=2 Tax=Homininae TaxID=207598 RepID=Q499Y1_HUMAN